MQLPARAARSIARTLTHPKQYAQAGSVKSGDQAIDVHSQLPEREKERERERESVWRSYVQIKRNGELILLLLY